jgi:hypothetical protein
MKIKKENGRLESFKDNDRLQAIVLPLPLQLEKRK